MHICLDRIHTPPLGPNLIKGREVEGGGMGMANQPELNSIYACCSTKMVNKFHGRRGKLGNYFLSQEKIKLNRTERKGKKAKDKNPFGGKGKLR